MTTAYILVRHLELQSEVKQLEIDGGQFVRIKQDASGRQHLIELEKCHTLFPYVPVFRTDWVYKKSYLATPPARNGNDPSGFVGDIPDEAEDLLLVLRLVQPGDISFVAQALVGEDGDSQSQLPYRYFSSIACASRILNSLAESRIEATLRGAWRLASSNEVRSHASLKGHTPSTFAGGHTVARAELNNVRWVSHCRDLVQLPVAA